MSKWKISLYLTALFLAGVVTGAVLTQQIGRRLMMKAMRPEAMAGHWCRELEGKLHLTAEQTRKITPIVSEGMTEFKTSLAERMMTGLTNCNARIAVELTPEQRTKLAEIEKEQLDFIRKKFGGEKVAATDGVKQAQDK